jgi:lathosterol oxidase
MQIIDELSITQLLIFQWIMNISRYIFVVGSVYFVFHKILINRCGFKLHKPKTYNSNIKREILYSLRTLTIFLIPTFLIVHFRYSGIFKVYYVFDGQNLGTYFISYVVMFLFHDTYFYFTHRLMHHPLMFKYFHSIHHQSVYPTPFAAFSFNASEALVESFVFVVAAMLFPIHISVLIIFTLFSLFMNVYGHLGMNIMSVENEERFLFNLINHPRHHGWHHRYHQGNFGLYLKFWDKVCGTWKGELK